jgi:aminomethyltransferase
MLQHAMPRCAVPCYAMLCRAVLQGKDAIKFLEGLVTGDIAGLADGTGSLSVFTNEKGGIIDDTVITKVG